MRRNAKKRTSPLVDKLKACSVNEQQQFVWLCAIRSLPFLGADGTFPFWPEAEQQKFLLSVFKAIDSIACVSDIKTTGFDVHEYNAVADSASIDAFGAFAALENPSSNAYIAMQVIACASAFVTGINPAEDEHLRSVLAASELGKDMEAILSQDIDNIKAGVNDFQEDNSVYGQAWECFFSTLYDMDCSYWVDWYINLFSNNFTLTEQRKVEIKFRLSAPHNIIALGASSLANYVEEKKPVWEIPLCTVFLSYCGTDSDLADIIDESLKCHAIKISRYNRDVSYRGSFKSFMQTINKHDFVVMLVSDNFLKSKACMYEVGELVSTRSFEEKLLFVIICDEDVEYYQNTPITPVGAKLYNQFDRLQYISYWETQYSCLEASIKSVISDSAKIEALEDVREIRKIIDQDIGQFMKYLADANGKSFGEMYSVGFQDIFNEIRAVDVKYKSIEQGKMQKEGVVTHHKFADDIPQNDDEPKPPTETSILRRIWSFFTSERSGWMWERIVAIAAVAGVIYAGATSLHSTLTNRFDNQRHVPQEEGYYDRGEYDDESIDGDGPNQTLVARGSTPGNFASGSPIAFTDQYIYFSNTADFRLWRMDYNGENRQRVGNFRLPSQIQYYDGWLYFTYDNGRNIIRLNTSSHNNFSELVDSQQTGQIGKMQVMNGFIYFTSLNTQGLQRMPLVGGVPEILIPTNVLGFTVTEDGIYVGYNTNVFDVALGMSMGSLYRYSLEGTQMNLIAYNICDARVSAEDGWIFFTTGADNDQYYIVKMRPDGSEQEIVIRVAGRISGGNQINVTDGWIYFWESCEETPMVIINNIYRNIVVFCRIRVDGTEFQEIIRSDQLRNLRSSFRREFAVYGGFAYITANNHDYDVGNSELYRIPIDGGSIELLQSRSN